MTVDAAGYLNELRERGLLPDDRLAVMIVGSTAKGWANTKSDIDFYLITESTWKRPGAGRKTVPLQPASVPTETVYVAGRRWELKYWLDAQIDQMFAKVSWAQFESGRSAVDPLVASEETCLERMVTCQPLEGEDWVARRRAELAATAFQAFLVTRSLAGADGAIEDVLGQLAAEDHDSAVLSARLALDYSVDALLESVGHYGSAVPKWRARRVKDAGLANLPFERYWELETMAGFDPANPRVWIERVVTLCKELSLEVEI